MKKFEAITARMRASWRTMVVALRGVTTRVKNNLTAKMQKHLAR